MEIPNLLLNLNYKDTCGQSSILQHLLTYSYELGIFPQAIDKIAEQRCFILRNDERVFGIPALIPNYLKATKQEDYFEILKECLNDCVDIEHNPILSSDFKFCLPASVNEGNLMTKNPTQCMYFAKQTGPLYIYDYNVRFKMENIFIVNEDNLRRLNPYYNLQSTTFNDFLSQIGEKISPQKPTQASNFIKDKPVALCNMAVEHGLDYTTEEGIDLFTNDFLSVDNTDDSSEMSNVTLFEINQLTANVNTSTEYYKYVCDSLRISENLELFDVFYDIFVKADAKQRLKIITRSDFLTNILCNETIKS